MNIMYLKRNLLGVFLIISFINLFNAKAQSKRYVSALVGYSDNGFSTLSNFAFSDYNVKDYYFEAGLYTGFLKERKTPYNLDVNIYTLNFGYFKRLPFLSLKRDLVLFHAGIGGLIGKESINNGSKELSNGALIISNGGTIYGGFASLQGSLFLNDRLSLLVRYNQFYHANSETNKNKMFVGAGLKFLIF